jgi:hypothetical protein
MSPYNRGKGKRGNASHKELLEDPIDYILQAIPPMHESEPKERMALSVIPTSHFRTQNTQRTPIKAIVNMGK